MTKEEQYAADLEFLRDCTWEQRCEVTDDLVLHDCWRRQFAQAYLRVIGWDPNTFVIADLMNERALLDV